MNALYTTEPSAVIRTVSGEHHIYYNVPDAASHLLPAGSTFAVITAPSPYMTFPAWQWREYVVIIRGEDRFYQVSGGRDLTAEEIEYAEQLIREWAGWVKQW